MPAAESARGVEHRILKMTSLRVAGEGAKRKIVGHAAVYDQEADLYWFKEVVRKGAFAGALSGKDDVRALFNHNADVVLGRNRAKTLSLADEPQGLAFEIDPPDTQAARDLMVSIDRGDVSQCSFGFRTIRDRWTFSNEPGKPDFRELLEVELFDVSPVTYPAYEQTDVGLRSAAVQGAKDETRALRDEARRRHDLEANRAAMTDLELAEAEEAA